MLWQAYMRDGALVEVVYMAQLITHGFEEETDVGRGSGDVNHADHDSTGAKI